MSRRFRPLQILAAICLIAAACQTALPAQAATPIVDVHRIEALLAGSRDELRRCYNTQVMRSHGKLHGGQLMTGFHVDARGRAFAIQIESNTLHNPKTSDA